MDKQLGFSISIKIWITILMIFVYIVNNYRKYNGRTNKLN